MLREWDLRSSILQKRGDSPKDLRAFHMDHDDFPISGDASQARQSQTEVEHPRHFRFNPDLCAKSFILCKGKKIQHVTSGWRWRFFPTWRSHDLHIFTLKKGTPQEEGGQVALGAILDVKPQGWDAKGG